MVPHRYILLSLLILSFSLSSALGQDRGEAIDGHVQIKLSEAAKSQLVGQGEALPQTITSEAQVGVQALNQLAQQFSVERMERVFRPAGKHEPRHVRWGLDRWYIVRYEEDVEPAAVARSYIESGGVESGSPVYEKKQTVLEETPEWVGDDEPDQGREAAARRPNDEGQTFIPDDPEYGSQWHYNNTSSNPGTPGADISLPEAHDLQTGDPSVVISVVDGGLDLDHPEFDGMLWTNEDEIPGNGIDDDNNGYVDDIHGYDHVNGDGEPDAGGDHGTHVAGTVAAKNGNGQFGGGVAGGDGTSDSGVRLMINKTFDTGSSGGFAEAIAYAADNGAVVSQNSWGYQTPGVFEQAVLDAIDYFKANAGGPDQAMNGGIFVNSSGNSDSDANYYPGVYENAYAVSATGPDDSKAGYSNYGDWMDVAAPGGQGQPYDENDVQSTVVGGFGSLAGTSMAAPHVSGIIGLVVSENPGMTDDAVEQLLKDTGVDISNNQPERMGPRVDAAAAVATVSGDDTPPAAITDLEASVGSSSEPGAAVELTWTAPGNDGMTGRADSYDIRYSLEGPIEDSTAFAEAQQVEREPAPDTAGTQQADTLEGLPFDSELHFAIRSADLASNVSGLSNTPSVVTSTGPVAVVDPEALSVDATIGETVAETVTLSNTGNVDLEFTIDENELPDYLTVSPSQDSLAAGTSQDLTLTFSTADLRVNEYEALLNATVTSVDGESDVVSVETMLNVTAAPYPFAVDTESIQETLQNPGDAPAETVTRTVTITNESDEPQTFEIYGGAATTSSVVPTTPLFNGEELKGWERRRTMIQNGQYDLSAQGTLQRRLEARSARGERSSSDFGQEDVEIPNAAFSGYATGLTGPFADQFVDVPIDDPPQTSSIGSSPFATAGNFAYRESDEFFVIVDGTNAFQEVDVETGDTTPIGTVSSQTGSEVWTEIATDPTDGTLYASTTMIGGGDRLYTITPPRNATDSVETAFVTEIETDGAIPATAIDGNGQMYGLEFPENRLVRINKATGAVTPIGSVGYSFDNLVFKGMDFDLKTGNLYLTSRVSTFVGDISFVFQVNPETGEGSVLGIPGSGIPGSALGYLANPSVGFVEPSLTQGTLPPGSSTEVGLTLTAERLNERTYNSQVFVRSNVAGEPSDAIDVTMNVEGEPQLAVVPEGDSAIAFDSTFVQDTTDAQVVTVRNEGTADMEATFSSSDQFSIAQDSVSLFPGEATTIDVSFTPTTTGSFEGALTVASSDSTDTVELTGVGVPRPIAEVDPSEFDVQMHPGQSYTRTLSMTNAGGSPLEFVGTESNVETPSPSAVAPPADGEDFEEGVPPDGWSTTDVPGQGVTWQTNEAYGAENVSGSGVAAHVSSNANPNVPYDARLRTPEKTFEEGTTLSFDLSFQSYALGTENFDVGISTDGGDSWSLLQRFEDDAGVEEGTSVVISNEDLGQYVEVGETFQIRFRYWSPQEAAWDYYAQVDNVSFSPPMEFFSFEPTEGTVPANSSEDLTLFFNAESIASGTYQVDMVFETNDPVGEDGDGTVTVPVTIDVIESLTVTPDPSESEVYPTQTFTVPITVESLDDLEVFSYKSEIDFNPEYLQVQEVITEGTLSEGLTLSSRIEDGTVTIAAVDGTEGPQGAGGPSLFDIEGEGTLVSLQVQAREKHGDGVVSVDSMRFNEGAPPASPQSDTTAVVPLYGDVDMNLSIMSADAGMVLDYTVGAISSLTDAERTHADVSGDGTVGAFDASLILRRTVGTVGCFPVDPACNGGPTALASQQTGGESRSSATFAWGEVSQRESGGAEEGKQLSLPLMLESADGSVQSIEVSTELDPEKVSVESVESQLPEGWQATHEVSDEGTLKIALAGSAPVSRSGQVATVTLRQEEAGAEMEMGGTVSVNEGSGQELEATSVVSIPDEFALEGTYPNPFSQTATLEMQLPEKASVTVEVYDVLGRQVKTAYDGELQAGASRTVRINGSDLSTGTYFYRVTVEAGEESRTESGRMTVVR